MIAVPKSLYAVVRTLAARRLLTLLALLSSSFHAHSVGWVARHGLSSHEYQDQFNSWTGQGLRLRCVSGYLNGANTEFAALWDDTEGPSQAATHNATAADIQSQDITMGNNSFQPTWISIYPVGNALRYAAIWEAGNANRVIRMGRTYAQLQSDKEFYEDTGYHLHHLSATTLGATDYYAAIWQKSTVHPVQIWKARMNTATYQNEFNAATAAGYRLVQSFGCVVGGEERFAAIWRKVGGDTWWNYGSLSAANYQTETENAYYQGYRTDFVSAYSVNGSPRFNSTWTRNGGWSGSTRDLIDKGIRKYMEDTDTPGLSLSIMRNGRLVYAKGFGYADQENHQWAGPLHRFRIASISKPITAAGVLKLIDDDKFELTDKVFGSGALLGTQYGNGNYSTWEKAINVRHLLNHTTGWAAESPMWDNSYGVDHERIMDWTLDSNSPQFEPGTRYDYMNLDYHTLGRIIEKYSGKSYENYIKDAILAPCGITQMQLGNQTKAGRLPREVVYAAPDGGNPYTEINPKRMDANGGWIATSIDLLQFLRRIDNEPFPSDILSSARRTEMRNFALTMGNGYGLGWFDVGGGAEGHNGCMTGTSSFMVDRNNGTAYAALANKRTGCSWDLNTAVDKILDQLEQKNEWPGYDLFPVPSQNYANWVKAVFAIDLSSSAATADFNLGLIERFAPYADPDRDRMSNLEEAYYGTDPNRANRGRVLTARIDGKDVVFRWTRSTEDVGLTGTPLFSTDLQTWAARRVTITPVGRPAIGVETVEIRLPKTNSQLFMKLEIETD
jgi:CubicO group peptidase (beta-lactamase class C family)